ncbi:MAG TPA: MBL fold metallo-hydrolase [Dehalococcoidia bacterium]|jgi:glyoxylase-like metal-dependent hydrolase (beta-lactamase superfamily II)|nr:MBL fold metallo-hydrolase [Dehalococcoidia bacterium]
MPPFCDYEYDVCCIDTEQVRTGLACAYLLRSGERYAFVDCGTSLSVPGLLDVLAHKGIAPEQVAYVMPTHVHLDHAGGAGALMRALPKAQLIAHPRAARHLIDPSKLIEGAAAVYGAQNLARMYGAILPVPESRVQVADDGFTLDFAGRELVFYDAPGHARHHYAIWDAASRGIFSGDVFGISYREFDGPEGPYLFPTTTPVQFEPEAWLATLDRLLALDPAWVYLTHFGRLGEVPRLARELKRGLVAYQRIARRHADAPDRHARIRAELTEHALHELAALDCPLSVAQAQRLLEFDMELNTQGLEVWLDRDSKTKKKGAPA